MQVKEIKTCLRCKDTKLVITYPIIKCLICHSTFLEGMHGELHSARFDVDDYHIRVMLLENITYVNSEKLSNTSLPIDISVTKLKTYLTFS